MLFRSGVYDEPGGTEWDLVGSTRSGVGPQATVTDEGTVATEMQRSAIDGTRYPGSMSTSQAEWVLLRPDGGAIDLGRVDALAVACVVARRTAVVPAPQMPSLDP